jgi:sterol desaturase/sphingolipid hydroxylase (fatty acid hydroxylase superfamily)
VIEWIETVLGVIAIACVFLGTTIVLMMINAVVKRMKKTKKEKTKMSKEAREGVTFNDIFMFMIAVPLVLLWVGFAGAVIYVGLGNSQVLESIESYTTLIAILGGPALLIIKDALDVWKQEQAEKTAFYKTKAQSVIDYNASVLQQAQDIEGKEQEQDHKERRGK